jgi:hypothetical protein
MTSKLIFLILNEASYTILLIQITFQKRNYSYISVIFTAMFLTWNYWQYIEGYSITSVKFSQITL